MEGLNVTPEEIKWNAVINCDSQFDGKFYYAVKTTGIFCRPSCRAKVPLKKNTLFFQSVVDAISAGYRACKMCRPDIGESMYEPNKEVIERTKSILMQRYREEFKLKAIAQELGISDSHLTRLFKQYYEMTPNEYIVKIRVEKSMELLISTDIGILEIAHEVGFKSLSTFYKNFKMNVGDTPKEYRRHNVPL